jgi:hypothetical protein
MCESRAVKNDVGGKGLGAGCMFMKAECTGIAAIGRPFAKFMKFFVHEHYT